jgi:hypothetical protein
MAKKPTKQEKEYHLWVMGLGCCVPYCFNQNIDFHHVKPPEAENYSPMLIGKPTSVRNHKFGVNLCREHHMAYHDICGTVENFNDKYDVWLPDEAELLCEEYWGDE